MNMNKICPNCRTEYFPNIEKCADCGAILLLPHEYEKLQAERRLTAEKALEDEVVVRQGDLRWLSELREVLIDSGIPCAVKTDTGCTRSRCGDKCGLVVSSADAEKARVRIEEYFMEIHPEMRVSKELISEGKCPACGSPVGPDARECPDCGLPLIIVEEDKAE